MDESLKFLTEANGVLLPVIAFAAVVVLSIVFKPLIKKILTLRRDKSLIFYEEVSEMYKFESEKDTSIMSAAELRILETKLKVYETQLAEQENVISERWFSDRLAQGCFAVLIVLCFAGTFAKFAATGEGYGFFLTASFYAYLAAAIGVAEAIYAVYEETGLKRLYKFITEKLKTK